MLPGNAQLHRRLRNELKPVTQKQPRSETSYKTAAAELHVSVNTIKFHLRHIYDKLQVHTKSEAVAKALRHGLTR